MDLPLPHHFKRCLFALFSLLGLWTPMQLQAQSEHIFKGLHYEGQVYERKAYLMHYNEDFRIPDWVAYHITPDYRQTPKRKSKFKRFRQDPDLSNPVDEDEYTGLFAERKYARGHLAPYAILGGDRDKDGKYAAYHSEESDPDEEQTVFEGNYMSNISPQHHYTLNGSGGLWYTLERWIQDDLVVDQQKEVWVLAGNVLIDTRTMEKVGPNEDIVVPDMLYKVVMFPSEKEKVVALAFLFPHFRFKEDLKQKDIFQYQVPANYIEALTGLDLLTELSRRIRGGHGGPHLAVQGRLSPLKKTGRGEREVKKEKTPLVIKTSGV